MDARNNDSGGPYGFGESGMMQKSVIRPAQGRSVGLNLKAETTVPSSRNILAGMESQVS